MRCSLCKYWKGTGGKRFCAFVGWIQPCDAVRRLRESKAKRRKEERYRNKWR